MRWMWCALLVGCSNASESTLQDAGATTDAQAEETATDSFAADSIFPEEDAGTTCTPDTCKGRGICDDSSGLAKCTCDEGFTGATCGTLGPDYLQRVSVVPGMADPDVFKENDDLYYLSGTTDGRTLPIYVSHDLRKFDLQKTFDPSSTDGFSYCDVWAPGFARSGASMQLYFSARRVTKGATCPASGTDVATFRSTAPAGTLDFGAPESINPGSTQPRTITASGCPAQGCDHAIRIDSHVFEDWFFYVYFDGGNNVASFPFATPDAVVHNAGPRYFTVGAAEEKINEGPFVFRRNGKLYLFFSGAWFNSQYAMYYVSGDTVGDLTRARWVHEHSRAIRAAGGRLLESNGHNSVTSRHGEFFNFFHVGAFDGAGNLTGRSTFRQRMTFKPNGEINSLNMVQVRWSSVAGHQYSLDLVKRDGSVVGPCVSAGTLGSTNRYTYTGVCPDGGNAMVPKSEVAAFRVYYSNDGAWTKHAEVAFDGASDDASIVLPGGTAPFVDLSWNEKSTGTTYSLDVMRSDGSWVAPCVGDAVLGRSLSYSFDGNCRTPGVNVPLSDVKRVRMCSAHGDWSKAVCGESDYSGALSLDVPIP